MNNIAICISGNISTLSTSIKNWAQFFDLSKIDLFYFGWSPTNIQIDVPNLKKSQLKDISFQSKILENFWVEYRQKWSFANQGIHQSIDVPTRDKFVLYLYELMYKSNLKRTYELDNNFQYDVCINLDSKCTFDKFEFDITKIIPGYVYTYNNSNISAFPFQQSDSQFFISDTVRYDMLSNMYKFVQYLPPDILDKLTEFNLLYYFIQMFKFINSDINNIGIIYE